MTIKIKKIINKSTDSEPVISFNNNQIPKLKYFVNNC